MDDIGENSETLSIATTNDFEITGYNIGHLDDVLRAILRKKSKEQRSFSGDVNGFFFDCRLYWQRYSDSNKIKSNHLQFFQCNYLSGLIQLLRESILSHKWTDVLEIINVLVKEGDELADILWKAGTLSLMMEKKSVCLDLYVRQLCRISKTPVEILFDYLLYLIMGSDLDRARDLSHDVTVAKSGGSNEGQMRIIFRAYLGLIEYMQWKEYIAQDESEEEEGVGLIMSQLCQGFSLQASKEKSEKAISHLSCICGIPGVWDIFIVKMVEIHQYYGDLHDARSLLWEYKAVNPDNLNAHRYHYEFETKHGKQSDDTLQNLKNVVRLDPSNPLALDLYKYSMSFDPEAVSILFDYLDFDHCKNDLQAWNLLKTHLSEVLGTARDYTVVTKCWSSRKDWWPSFALQTDDECDSFDEISSVKRKVHEYLNKQEC